MVCPSTIFSFAFFFVIAIMYMGSFGWVFAAAAFIHRICIVYVYVPIYMEIQGREKKKPIALGAQLVTMCRQALISHVYFAFAEGGEEVSCLCAHAYPSVGRIARLRL
uniref:Uncharacterized protein n=1 Tax=Rhipicephalus microplus TaxID=6941 RepID=A0A6M2D9L1_RHIMP